MSLNANARNAHIMDIIINFAQYANGILTVYGFRERKDEMTVQEAIKILDNVSNDIKESTPLGQAFEIALVRLEKQIPSEPECIEPEDDGDCWVKCNCGAVSHSNVCYSQCYCWRCGQLLELDVEEGAE